MKDSKYSSITACSGSGPHYVGQQLAFLGQEISKPETFNTKPVLGGAPQ